MQGKPSADDSVDILDKQVLYQGYFRMEGYRLRHRLYGGGWSEEMHREIFERGHAVGVLPYDPDLDSVVLIEQFRLGALLSGMTPWQIEIVAGMIDEGESAEAVALREAEEEAGCGVRDLVPIQRYLATSGASTETVWLFCGRADARGLGGVHGLDHEHEDILAKVVPVEEAFALLDAGKIENAAIIIALHWLRHHRPQLRDAWLTNGQNT
jgi:ADP-ribose pyrophosphatase